MSNKRTPSEKKERRQVRGERRTLRWKLVAGVATVMFVSTAVVTLIYWVILLILGERALGIRLAVSPLFIAAVLLCACAMVATVLFGLLSKYYLQPLRRLIRATQEIGEGHFNVRVQEEKPHFYQIMPELQELVRNFNKMAEELRGIELFRNDFINNFSHEFKTPIISIRGFARELQRDDLTDVQRAEYARIIEEESGRLSRLSANVLTLSRLEKQQIVTGKTDFYLDEQIRQCILTQESDWAQKEIEIVPELPVLSYCGNEEMLALVWRNLISNAIKFTPRGGSVRISMSYDEQSVTVAVQDTGIGMSEAVRKRVFEKFYQGDPSHARAGYGIGLALVDRILTLSNGSVTVESEPGKGSCFSVTLPR